MNEFMVWDNKRKQFMGDGEVIISNYGENKIQACPNSMEYINDSTHNYYEDSRWTFHQYIGLKDINNNKIYADCSIVEFTLKDNIVFADFTGVKPTVWNEIKMIGYFTFNDEDLRYEIDILDWEKDKAKSQFICLYYNFERMSNFKIIDTIQENKLGLIKE